MCVPECPQPWVWKIQFPALFWIVEKPNIFLFIYSFIHSLSKYSLGTSCVPSSEHSGVSKTLLSRALILQSGGCVKVPVLEYGFCPHSLSAPPGLTPGPRPAMYFFGPSAVDSVSWLCGGPGLEPKGGRGRAVLNFRPGFGAVTLFP